MKTDKIKSKSMKSPYQAKPLNKIKVKSKIKSKAKDPKKKLGMGLSSLLSKDQELASIIKSKVENEVKGSSFKIQQPKLSNKDGERKPIINLKPNINMRLRNHGNNNLPTTLPIQQLVSGKFQPRKRFEQTELEELADSIRNNGVLQPILVRPLTEKSSTYEIIAGERRWRASQLAKLHEVPVIVRNFSDETSIGVAMIENLQRTDLNLIEEAEGYRTMMNVFQYTQEKLSSQLGKSRSHIANVLRVLSLSQNVKKHILNGEISFGHARALVTLNDEQALEATEQVIQNQLNVRQTEKLVNSIRKSNQNRQNGLNENQKLENKNSNIEHLERELTNLLGLKVIVSHKSNNTGNLAIYYKTLDQIQPVIDKLKWRPK
ncbi:MAG: ParB/RepB/Spo0J family partition protein [Alphaproteobacteria bacterium]